MLPLLPLPDGWQKWRQEALGVQTLGARIANNFTWALNLALFLILEEFRSVWYTTREIIFRFPMDDQQQEELQQALEQQRTELRELLNRSANKDKHVRDDFHARFPSYGDDDEANAEEVSDFEDTVGIDRDLERLLQETDAALEALKQGTYGMCRVCGKPIEQERLIAMPSTTLCLEHKATPTV